MVVLLLRTVLGNLLHIRRAHGETSITTLPMERRQGFSLGLDPLGRTRLDLLYNSDQGRVFREAEESVHVVAGPADLYGGRARICEHGCQVRVQVHPQRRRKQGLAMLGAEDQVDL